MKIFRVIFIALLFFVLAFFLKTVFTKQIKPAANQNDPEKILSQPATETLWPAVNGLMVQPELAGRPVAVVVENHPDSRPQSGLAGAGMVYETLAEGGITRFMAVYQQSLPENIGPVRSARTYFAEIADELGAVFAHVGGNSDALAGIKAGVYKRIENADQFFLDSYFRRSASRPMPHNVYASAGRLRQLIADKNWDGQNTAAPWLYKDDEPAAEPVENISVDFSTEEYRVKWQYDKTDNSYLRFLAGKPHTDLESGRQIEAKNILVQYVKTFSVQSDTPLSIGMDLDGGGKAVVFFDGKAIPGTWKKEGGRTRFYDGRGFEIKLNRGISWVELVPKEKNAEWR